MAAKAAKAAKVVPVSFKFCNISKFASGAPVNHGSESGDVTIACDVGGTFTDLIVRDNQGLQLFQNCVKVAPIAVLSKLALLARLKSIGC
jgi:hypothetical protein